jgi:hypothetical protein
MKRIIYQNESGGVSVIIPTGELSIEEVAAKDVPQGVPYEIVEDSDIPSDRFFRGAWVMGDCCVEHDLDQCKKIGHAKRREMRAGEFAPYDDIIAKQIPGADAAAAENARLQIREKYAFLQELIDTALTPEAIKSALEAAQ